MDIQIDGAKNGKFFFLEFTRALLTPFYIAKEGEESTPTLAANLDRVFRDRFSVASTREPGLITSVIWWHRCGRRKQRHVNHSFTQHTTAQIGVAVRNARYTRRCCVYVRNFSFPIQRRGRDPFETGKKSRVRNYTENKINYHRYNIIININFSYHG